MSAFRREIRWEPGFDYRNDPAKKQYGCHGLQFRWLLHGEQATIQFVVMTPWLPTWKPYSGEKIFDVFPADIGYHADKPQYPDHGVMKCTHRAAGECYYDGSSLMANDGFRILITEGEEAVWAWMQKFYDDRFIATESEAA